MAAFEANPGWEDAVALRRWDDQAKVPDLEVPPAAAYRPLLESLRHPLTAATCGPTPVSDS